jgi:hypothetical protein
MQSRWDDVNSMSGAPPGEGFAGRVMHDDPRSPRMAVGSNMSAQSACLALRAAQPTLTQPPHNVSFVLNNVHQETITCTMVRWAQRFNRKEVLSGHARP